MRRRSFVRVLDGIVTAVLASSIGVACGGATEGGSSSGAASSTSGAASSGGTSGPASSSGTSSGGTSGVPNESVCEMPLTEILAAATPSAPVDFIEIRQDRKEKLDGDDVTTVLATRGTPCSGASDKAACTSALAALKTAGTNEGWGTGDRGNGPQELRARRYAVYSRGDETGILKTEKDLGAFFAPIDDLADVRLVLHTFGLELSCTTDPPSTVEKEADGSYRVSLIDTGCGTYRFDMRVKLDGTAEVIAQKELEPNACGRRPEGLRPPGAPVREPTSAVGEWFARVAHLEAASVVAFARLEEELAELGAPARLRAMARRARRDEVRHAAQTSRLARRFDGEPRPVAIAPKRTRTPFEIARENAVEGCVRETYGALVAAWQARTASDPSVRATLAQIAVDEARHAELAWSVARWLEPRLDAAERAAIDEARRAAIEELRSELEAAPDAEVVRVAGVPDPTTAAALVERLVAVLFEEVANAA